MPIQTSLQALELDGAVPQPGDTGEATLSFTVISVEGDVATLEAVAVNGAPATYSDAMEEPAETELSEDDLRNQAKAYDQEGVR